MEQVMYAYYNGSKERMRAVKKILFFPLLRMPSGHHQVADSVAAILQKRDENVICKKVDLLSEWNAPMEQVITKVYLEWIHLFPKNYAWVYKKMAYQSKGERSYKYYEWIFLKKMKEILYEEKPDLIICTHGFPSYFLSLLKRSQQCNVPVINVYTDFFINDVWGREGIDYHFVPSVSVKNLLIRQYGIPENHIVVTGIPTDERFETKPKPCEVQHKRTRVLVSGGSVGLGSIEELLQNNQDSKVDFYILCGRNKKLLDKIQHLNQSNLHPLPYISSREKMNELYNKVDAIITKPGGVTISEALKKGLPIFIHSALPGQEEINLKLLMDLGLVKMLKEHQPIDEQMRDFFGDPSNINQFKAAQRAYLMEIMAGNPNELASFLLDLLHYQSTRLA
jgi:processive 1,2-diacylglycerol beta-glucosyltransferase